MGGRDRAHLSRRLSYGLWTCPPPILSGSLLAVGPVGRSPMTNMIVYLIGTLLVVAGLAYGASRLGISQVWIVAGALVIVGLGLMAGIVKTRQKDPAA